MKTIVKLDDRDAQIDKLPIARYADLVRSIKKLPQHFIKLENLSRDKIIAILPDLAIDSLPDLIELMSVMVQMPKEDVEKLGLHEIVRLFEGFWQANKFDEIGEVVKKALAHPTIAKYTQKAIDNEVKRQQEAQDEAPQNS